MKYRRRDQNFANDGDTSFNQRVNMGFMETMKEILLEDFQYNVVLVIANNCH
jgi:hypothetical protein